jgi:hypothetical protein
MSLIWQARIAVDRRCPPDCFLAVRERSLDWSCQLARLARDTTAGRSASAERHHMHDARLEHQLIPSRTRLSCPGSLHEHESTRHMRRWILSASPPPSSASPELPLPASSAFAIRSTTFKMLRRSWATSGHSLTIFKNRWFHTIHSQSPMPGHWQRLRMRSPGVASPKP